MAKTKYADGGMTQQPTYPFYGNQPQAGGQNGGTNQTFNMQPQANVAPNPQQQPMQTVKKEVSFMKSKGAPKSMIKHEMSEAGMKKGGMMKKMAGGGMTSMGKVKTAAPSINGVAVKGKTKGTMVKMAGNKNMKKGGYC